MIETLTHVSGVIPAIIYPAAAVMQLLAISRKKSAEGVSVATWVMVGIANICLFVYTGSFGDILPIVALLGAAVLNFCVAALAVHYQRKRSLT